MLSFKKAGKTREVLRALPEQLSGGHGRDTGESTLQPPGTFRMPWWSVSLSFTSRSQCGAHEVKVDGVST